MQPLIYKERVQRWGFKQSMLTSLIFHGIVIFGVSFVVIQQPWEFNEEAIVNIRFANEEFDMQGNSNSGFDSIQRNNQKAAMATKDSNPQDQSQFSVRRLESNSTLESYETIYLNAWQRQVETTGYFQISQKDIIQGNFKVQIRSIIDSKGNLIGADILKSSGNSSMDALALKILQQAAPFEPFPVDMAANYQQLEIIRDWNFTNS